MFLCLKKYKQLLYLDKPELTKTYKFTSAPREDSDQAVNFLQIEANPKKSDNWKYC